MSRALLLLCSLFVLFSKQAEARLTRRLPAEGIVGGDDATEGQYPYQVSLKFGGEDKCGGSILSERLVLTAAHCVIAEDDSFMGIPIKVISGTSELGSSCSVTSDVVEVYVPGGYNASNFDEDSIPAGDIAILKLNEDLGIQGNAMLGKVKLPKKDDVYEGKRAIVSGFGLNEISILINPYTGVKVETMGKRYNKLRFAEVNVISREECKALTRIAVMEHHICAAVVQRDANRPEGVCSGDSGGPLVRDGVQIGVLSLSPVGCREDEQPAIYTRVVDYLGFVDKVASDKIDGSIRTTTLKISSD